MQKPSNRIHSTTHILLAITLVALTACGGGGSSSTSGGGTTTGTRLASEVSLPNTLTGDFAEGISADPATGDLYAGTDGTSSTLASLVLKAGAQESAFSAWLPFSTLGGPTNAFVAGTRIKSGKLYACINFAFSSAQVWAINLSDKSATGKFSLPTGETFCNDLAFDASGNLFATTNGSSPSSESVYKLAATTVQTGGVVAGTSWVQWSTAGGAVNGLVFDTANSKLLWSQDNRVVSSATGSPTATPTTEATLTTVTFIDGMQLTSAGNLLLVTNTGAQVVSMASATKGTLTAITGGANCTSTIAVVGDDAYCSSNVAPGKALRLAGAGKL